MYINLQTVKSTLFHVQFCEFDKHVQFCDCHQDQGTEKLQLPPSSLLFPLRGRPLPHPRPLQPLMFAVRSAVPFPGCPVNGHVTDVHR